MEDTHLQTVYFYKGQEPFFKRFYLFRFRDRGREGARNGEKHPSVACQALPTGDLAHNPGMCPDGESNLQPFGLQSSA